jgi:ribonuclease VapC
MIVDASVLVALALDEPDRDRWLRALDSADIVAIGAPTLAEAGIVLSARTGSDATHLLGELIAAGDMIVMEFGDDHWRSALDAWWRFGRGRHPAALNLGDCLAYASARVSGLPLLAKGDDFARTDIELA